MGPGEVEPGAKRRPSRVSPSTSTPSGRPRDLSGTASSALWSNRTASDVEARGSFTGSSMTTGLSALSAAAAAEA